LAQIRPTKGDIPKNIAAHQKFIHSAVEQNANAIFFPELSLTSYEPELAADLAINRHDARLTDFQQLSNKYSITIGSGAPVKTEKGIHIGMLIFQAHQAQQCYFKQQLHEDELPYFVEGEKQLVIELEGERIVPAICYESLRANHAAHANRLNASIYLASIAKPQGGLEKVIIHYPQIAKQHNMIVAMVNCIGFCGNFESVGGSGVWSKKGELLAQMEDKREGILVFDTESEETEIFYF
ncbi:MAG: carbon-nitrogen hydrolase family protein, partial [Bacteroidota bacterium]